MSEQVVHIVIHHCASVWLDCQLFKHIQIYQITPQLLHGVHSRLLTCGKDNIACTMLHKRICAGKYSKHS